MSPKRFIERPDTNLFPTRLSEFSQASRSILNEEHIAQPQFLGGIRFKISQTGFQRFFIDEWSHMPGGVSIQRLLDSVDKMLRGLPPLLAIGNMPDVIAGFQDGRQGEIQHGTRFQQMLHALRDIRLLGWILIPRYPENVKENGCVNEDMRPCHLHSLRLPCLQPFKALLVTPRSIIGLLNSLF